MKTKRYAILGMITLLSIGAFAQNNEKKFGFELNTGASFPVKELGNTQLNPGFGFESVFHYRFMSHLGVYAGWGWNRLSAENSFAGNDACFEETGYVFGLQFMHPIADYPISYYFRGAGLYNHIEIEHADIVHDTGHGFGYQIAGGINLNLGKDWSLNPGVKFNALSRSSDFEGISMDMDYQYISVRVGLIKQF